jgi:hypothetical protein
MVKMVARPGVSITFFEDLRLNNPPNCLNRSDY